MLLFQKAFHAGLVAGAITLTFRRWDKPHVKARGRYRCHPIGVLEVVGVDRVRARDVSAADAKRSGFSSPAELLAALAAFGGGLVRPDTELYRVELRYGGDGDRVEGALDATIGPADVLAIEARLAKFDAKSPWTSATLDLIRRHPRIAASRLAKELGRETAPFKADVVRLKKLGLTQSFEVGYEVSPRGLTFLAARAGDAKGAPPNGPRGRRPRAR